MTVTVHLLFDYHNSNHSDNDTDYLSNKACYLNYNHSVALVSLLDDLMDNNQLNV